MVLLTLIPPTPGVWVAILLIMLLIGLEVGRQFNPTEHGRSLLQKLAYSFVASDRGEGYRQTRVDHAPKLCESEYLEEVGQRHLPKLIERLIDPLVEGLMENAIKPSPG